MPLNARQVPDVRPEPTKSKRISIKKVIKIAVGIAFALAAYEIVKLFLTHPGL